MPPDWVYPYMIADIEGLIAAGDDNAVLQDFAEKVDNLGLEAADTATLRAEASHQWNASALPAYQRLLDELKRQQAIAPTDDGIWRLPEGEAYYSALLNSYTTTTLSADEIHNIGLREVARIHDQMREIMTQVGFEGSLQDFFEYTRTDDRFYYTTREEYLADAQAVCDKLGIELHTVNFAAEYWDNVFELFLEEYKAGRTPNPDILCNKEIKFKAFLEFAAEDLGADYIATGHYVRRADVNGKSQLLRGLDGNKDQSYFLYTLSHEQIAQSLFPVGELEKPEVRKIAEELDLITAKKKDSTGICFIGERKFREFLGRYLPAQPGKIVTVDGDEIGQHQGLMYHTLGQRKGLGIGGTKDGSEDPWYVVDKDVENNILVVAQGHEHPRLMSVGLIAQQLHWVDREPLKGTLRCTVKTRYRQTDIPCTVTALDDDRIEVRFDEPVSAVTPGQSAVFYSGEICLGGGIIEQRLPLPAV
jgi:tRNA-specific 2-thiouridylase